MTCPVDEADIVDVARGIAAGGETEAAVGRHVAVCPACAARLERERSLTSAIRALAAATPVPDDVGTERALLAAFRHSQGTARSSRPLLLHPAWIGLAAAASVALLLGAWAVVSWRDGGSRQRATAATGVAPVARQASVQPAERVTGRAAAPATTPARPGAAAPSRRVTRVVEPEPVAERLSEFVALPVAEGLPGFDSGMIVRVAIPAASLPALGLPIVPDATRPLDADVLFGQDGQARAIRLVGLSGGPGGRIR